MIRAHNAAPGIINLFFRAAIVIFAAALILGMVSKTDNDTVRAKQVKRPKQVASGSSEVSTSLVIGNREGPPLSQHVLRDIDGTDLMHITYFRKKVIFLSPGRGFPVPVRSTVTADGTYTVSLNHGRYRYRLGLRSDGSSDVLVFGPTRELIGSFGVTPTGEFVPYISHPEEKKSGIRNE